MRSTDVIKTLLFLTAWRESDGKAGIYGEIIAWCLANRVRRNMGTWLEVIKNVPRYRANEPIALPEFPNLWEPQVMQLMQAVDMIYENASEDKANGGLYYAFTEKGVNDWFRDFVIKSGNYSQKSAQNGLVCWGETFIVGREQTPWLKGAQSW